MDYQRTVQAAANILTLVHEGRVSLNKAVYEDRTCKNKALLKAMVFGTARSMPILEAAVGRVDGDFSFKDAVLLHEYSQSRDKRRFRGISSTFDLHRVQWAEEYRRAKQTVQPLVDVSFPFKHVRSMTGRIEGVTVMCDVPRDLNMCCRDTLIPDLYIFPERTNFADMSQYQRGELIIQDKASCLPAFVLKPAKGSIVVDACSSPGNKSSQLWSYVGPSGQVISIERSKPRFETLKRMLSRSSLSTDCCFNMDFIEYSNAECTHILVDPSCSGSGMPMTLERQLSRERDEQERLEDLSALQTKLVCHAMDSRAFPKCHRVVYSTCSVHEEENERVVERVLAANPDWEVVDCLPGEHCWPHRGLSSFPFASKLLRSYPITDGPIEPQAVLYQSGLGFFVAMFERK